MGCNLHVYAVETECIIIVGDFFKRTKVMLFDDLFVRDDRHNAIEVLCGLAVNGNWKLVVSEKH